MSNEMIIGRKAIEKDRLEPDQYTISLLKEGMRLELVDRQAMYSIQEQVICIMRDLIMRYTKGDSTSVKVETAEGILSSIYYCIDAYIRNLNSPEEGLEALKSGSLAEMHRKGMELVAECAGEARKLYGHIVRTRLDVPLIAYNATIDEALPEFFEKYGVVFEAHEIMGSIDYPLAMDDMKLRGVYYIKNYLETLDIETRFCRLFPVKAVENALKGYGRLCHVDYREPLVNIFELIINYSIFSVLAGNNAGLLSISESQYELLNRRINGLSDRELHGLADMAVDRVINDLNIEQADLIEYIYRYKDLFIPRLCNAVRNGSLHNMIIIDAAAREQAANIRLEEGRRMSDEAFRGIIRDIANCGNAADRISIIKEKVNSLEDFIDILNGDCLFGDEYAGIFATLSDMELAVLGKAAFSGQQGDGIPDLLEAAAAENDMAEEWRKEYVRFLQGMERSRIDNISALIDAVSG